MVTSLILKTIFWPLTFNRPSSAPPVYKVEVTSIFQPLCCTDIAGSSTACKHGRFMSECEYVSKTWHTLCTPRSERLHFLISKLDTLDSWPLTSHFTWVAKRPCSLFSGSCRVAGVTVDTAVLCYAELWAPPYISTNPSLRKSVSNQMDPTAVCVQV